MYSHLSKREKQKKLALARKRAIVWSTNEQLKLALKTTTSLATLTTSPIVPNFTYRDPTQIETISNTSQTIQALEQSIADLEIQRQHLDITLAVLRHRLDSLLQEKTLSSAPK